MWLGGRLRSASASPPRSATSAPPRPRHRPASQARPRGDPRCAAPKGAVLRKVPAALKASPPTNTVHRCTSLGPPACRPTRSSSRRHPDAAPRVCPAARRGPRAAMPLPARTRLVTPARAQASTLLPAQHDAPRRTCSAAPPAPPSPAPPLARSSPGPRARPPGWPLCARHRGALRPRPPAGPPASHAEIAQPPHNCRPRRLRLRGHAGQPARRDVPSRAPPPWPARFAATSPPLPGTCLVPAESWPSPARPPTYRAPTPLMQRPMQAPAPRGSDLRPSGGRPAVAKYSPSFRAWQAPPDAEVRGPPLARAAPPQ
mmetsp:Transcript_88637/g.286277  ORF Transcript_88637/g.286277 Transcript_88637/m.286277 type:complete len:315 (-) Transcript_88637:714-1658(-)